MPFRSKKIIANLPEVTRAFLDIARIDDKTESRLKETTTVAYIFGAGSGKSVGIDIESGVPQNYAHMKRYSDIEQLGSLQNRPSFYVGYSSSEIHNVEWDALLSSTAALLRITDSKDKIIAEHSEGKYGRRIKSFLGEAIAFATNISGSKSYFGLIKGSGKFPDPKDTSLNAIYQRLSAQDHYLPDIVSTRQRTEEQKIQHILEHSQSYVTLLPYVHGRSGALIKKVLRDR